MRPSLVLRGVSSSVAPAAARLTLFTRAHCGLCDTAKARLVEVRTKRRVEYTEVDILAPGQRRWRDVYEFDVPVLHVDPPSGGDETTSVDAARKLWHRFTVEEVEREVDAVSPP